MVVGEGSGVEDGGRRGGDGGRGGQVGPPGEEGGGNRRKQWNSFGTGRLFGIVSKRTCCKQYLQPKLVWNNGIVRGSRYALSPLTPVTPP